MLLPKPAYDLPLSFFLNFSKKVIADIYKQIQTQMKNTILADDDTNDCEVFQDAVKELIIQTKLSILKNGVALMTTLEETVLALEVWQTPKEKYLLKIA